MISAINQERVAVTRHRHHRLPPILVVTELRPEAGFRPIAVVIDLLEIRLLGRPFRVVLVRWIPGPAAVIAVQFADEQPPGAARAVLPENMEDPSARVRRGRADLDHFDLFRRNPKGREWLVARPTRHGHLGTVPE